LRANFRRAGDHRGLAFDVSCSSHHQGRRDSAHSSSVAPLVNAQSATGLRPHPLDAGPEPFLHIIPAAVEINDQGCSHTFTINRIILVFRARNSVRSSTS
jgi:hypothetical protein